MGYRTLRQCVNDLLATGQMIQIDVPVDPDLEMADLEQFEVPWYFLVLGLVLFGAVVVGIQRLARRLLEERTVGQKDASVYRARNPSI